MTLKIHDKRIRALLRHLAAGNSITVACALAGVHRTTYYRWLEEGREHIEREEKRIAELITQGIPEEQIKPEPPTLQMLLVEGVPEAQAKGEAELLKRNRNASKGPEGDWKAAAWILERTRPASYARRQAPPEQEETDEMVIIG